MRSLATEETNIEIDGEIYTVTAMYECRHYSELYGSDADGNMGIITHNTKRTFYDLVDIYPEPTKEVLEKIKEKLINE